MRTHLTRLAAPIAGLAILLTACSSDESTSDDPTTPAEDVTADDDQGIAVGEPNGPQSEDDGAASGTMPVGEVQSTEERVALLLGSTEQEAENHALEFGWTVRVGRVDDETYALTEDYVIGRMTIELDTDADGATVVTRVVVELEDGPETFDA